MGIFDSIRRTVRSSEDDSQKTTESSIPSVQQSDLVRTGAIEAAVDQIKNKQYEAFEHSIFSSLRTNILNLEECYGAFRNYIQKCPDPVPHEIKKTLQLNMRDFITARGYRTSFETLDKVVFLEGDDWCPDGVAVSNEFHLFSRAEYRTFETEIFEILQMETPNYGNCIAAFKTYASRFPLEIPVRTKRALLTNMRNFIHSRGYRASFQSLDEDVFDDRISRYSHDRLSNSTPEKIHDPAFLAFASRFAEEEFVSNFQGFCIRFVDRFASDFFNDSRRPFLINNFVKLLALVGIYRSDRLVYKMISEVASGKAELKNFQQDEGKATNRKTTFHLDFDGLNDLEFENLIATIFTKAGYQVEHTPYENDMGADLVARNGGNLTAIRTRHTEILGPTAVQQVVASMMYYKATSAMVIASGTFTQSAIELALANHVILWGRDELSHFIDSLGQ